MKSIKIVFLETMKELCWSLILIGGCGAAGILICMIAVKGFGAHTFIPLGTMFALMLTGFYIIFVGSFSYAQEFRVAIAMGRKRKSFFFAYFIVSIAHLSIQALALFLVMTIETALGNVLFQGARNEMPLHTMSESFYLFAGIILIAAVIRMLLGGTFLRFGMKAFWVFWVIWMVTFTIGSKIVDRVMSSPLREVVHALEDAFSEIGASDGIMQMILLVIIEVVMLEISWLLVRKTEYR